MPLNPKRAPEGQWVMPKAEITTALGEFVMGWAALEAMLEFAIAKQLRLGPIDGSIVTSGNQFKSRCAILLSLLNRDPKRNEAPIKTVKAMRDITDRNDIKHSVIGSSREAIWFNRRTTNDRFKSKIEFYDAMRLRQASLKCSGLATDLQVQLGVTKEAFAKFFQDAHNRANSTP